MVFEDEVGSDNGIIVDKDIKGEVDVNIGDSLFGGEVGRDDSKECGLGIEDDFDS